MKYNRWLLRRVRNLLAALVNGAITLTILLIAPLGLAAVITNTLLVMAGTFFSEEITFFSEEITDFWIGMLRRSIAGEIEPNHSQTSITRYRDRD
jgi:hypothetical protein